MKDKKKCARCTKVIINNEACNSVDYKHNRVSYLKFCTTQCYEDFFEKKPKEK